MKKRQGTNGANGRRLKLAVLIGSAVLTPWVWALENHNGSTPAALLNPHHVQNPALASDAPPALLLAEVYAAKTDPTAYWVSEKLDGVRAFWDGKTLRFRSGRRVQAPDWFIAGLPADALDGELWLGRGRFDELSGIVRKTRPVDAEWRQVRYMIFELPPAAGDSGSDVFSDRVVRLKEVVSQANVAWLQPVEQFRVADHASLMNSFDRVVAASGEGLMLHRADAPYLAGRNAALQKLKPTLDAEATVVGYVAGRGRLAGGVGSLQLEMPNGKRFRLSAGLSDAERHDPPSLGSRITYQYQNLSKQGVPRFARYWRRDVL